MSSDSSLDSEEEAEMERRMDDYFPKPRNTSYITKRGFKSITVTEEGDLLGRGVMTFYRGHLDSRCCEACDHALRTSDKYARQKGELRPVEVQRHKYIEKKRIGCGGLRETNRGPFGIKTGFTVVVNDDPKKMMEKYNQDVRDKNHRVLMNMLDDAMIPLYQSSMVQHNPEDVTSLMKIIMEYDYSDAFFRYSEINRKRMNKLKDNISFVIENMRQNMLHTMDFNESGNRYGAISSLILVMVKEFTIREGVKNHLIAVSKFFTNKYNLTFKNMVRDLSKLPIYKQSVKRPTKVKFNHSDSEKTETNQEFNEKRKKMDTCPSEVTGRNIIDLYDLPTIE